MNEVRSLHPTPDQYAYAFGGREPLLTVPPGTVVELSTEDCFAGNVRAVDDLPSEVCTFPFLNPVTGPIAVEGAEPGDTIAVHFVEIVPARDWGASSTFPHFGALTTTHATAMLHEALEERVWMYDPGGRRGADEHHAGRSRRQHGHPGDARRGHGVLPGQRSGRPALRRRRTRPPGRGRGVRRGRSRTPTGSASSTWSAGPGRCWGSTRSTPTSS